MELVRLGHGVSFVPQMATSQARGLVFRSLAGDRPTRTLAIVWSKLRYRSPLFNRFVNALVILEVHWRTKMTARNPSAERKSDSKLEEASSMHHESAEVGRGDDEHGAAPAEHAKEQGAVAAPGIALGHQHQRRGQQSGGGAEPTMEGKDAAGGAAVSVDVCMKPAKRRGCGFRPRLLEHRRNAPSRCGVQSRAVWHERLPPSRRRQQRNGKMNDQDVEPAKPSADTFWRGSGDAQHFEYR